MEHRRLSAAEKGKGAELGDLQPPRTARVKVPQPDNTELLRKHSLTLIGRVTNKSTQKVWSLIPFFTEHWKTEFKPVGADLGNGLFQFQFELESDLLSVLEQRPYHYARWLVILQRWEPTVSPTFPSLIPFWIKVQGLPVHLWTEETIECIGRDIGLYEKAEITRLSARMRVHVNGLLPVITTSVVEFPNGDEVTTSLVYERLDKHCTKCLRLDHELKECLVARAEAKALKGTREVEGRLSQNSAQESGSIRGASLGSAPYNKKERDLETRGQAAFHFSAVNSVPEQQRRCYQEGKQRQNLRGYKSQTRTWQERGMDRRTYSSSERSKFENARSNRTSREHHHPYQRDLATPPVRSYYREVQRKLPEVRDSGSSISKNDLGREKRGTPLDGEAYETIPPVTLHEARVEVRDVMLQYTKCADPTEREARQERVRQAEERGQMEDAAVQLAQSSLVLIDEEMGTDPKGITERLSASKRLGPIIQGERDGSVQNILAQKDSSRERIPATSRLGERTSPTSQPRVPVSLRLGIIESSDNTAPGVGDGVMVKRKPGRPPGKRKVAASPKPIRSTSTKKRKPENPPGCRKKLSTAEPRMEKISTTMRKGEASRPMASGGNSHSSDNVPLSRMIPKPTRKKADFRIPSAPAP